MIYTLENEKLKISVNSKGAELVGITDKATGEEMMWNADGEYWNRVSPVLFPFIGRLKNEQYTHDGKVYGNIPQHGWARDTEFALILKSDDTIFLGMESDDGWKENYPFDFALKIGYKLTDKKVDVIWEIENTSDFAMHYSIGAHPAFMCRGGHDGWSLKFSGVNDMLLSGTLNTNGLLTEEVRNIPLKNGTLALYNGLFDRDALVMDSKNIHTVTLADTQGREKVAVHFDTPQLGIWTKGGKNTPFICIEPWYGRADRDSFSGQLADREYSNSLDGGETDTKVYTIEIL